MRLDYPTGLNLLLVLGLFSLTGCATAIKGTTQPIQVGSEPAGADILLDGVKVGQTPASIPVKRQHDHLLTVEKPGYYPENFALVRNVNVAVAGNILLGMGTMGVGSLVGWGADAMSGAQYNLTPAVVNPVLRPLPSDARPPPAAEDRTARFVEELGKLDALHQSGKITDEDYRKMRAALVDGYAEKKNP